MKDLNVIGYNQRKEERYRTMKSKQQPDKDNTWKIIGIS